jgi:hypothetical protein
MLRSTTISLWIVFISVSPLCGWSQEIIEFEGDPKKWVYIGDSRMGEATFIPKDQNQESWEEAILYRHISRLDIPLKHFYQNFIYLLNKRMGNLFQTRLINEGENFVLLEWSLESDIPGAEHGWIKIYRSESGLNVLRYTTKNVELVEKIRPIWENVLSQFELDMIPEKIQFNIDWESDGREWVQTEETSTLKKFYLKGDEADNWNEEVTVEIIKPFKESLRHFYENYMDIIRSESAYPITSYVLYDTNDQMLFEWWYEADNKRYHEWVYVSTEKPKVPFIARHASKNLQQGEKLEEIWEEIIRGLTVDVTYSYEVKRPSIDTEVDKKTNVKEVDEAGSIMIK